MLCSNTVLGNGAPTVKTPANVGDIQPVNSFSVNIINERITYSGLKNRGKYKSMTSKIEYTLKNESSTEKNLNVVFPFDSPFNDNDINVEFNGTKLDSKILDNIDYFGTFKIDRHESEDGWRDPKTVFFEFKMEGNQVASLVVSYTHFSGFREKKFNFLYYLQPAKYWAGYKDLSIAVELPDNYALTSNLDFKLLKSDFLKNEYVFSSKTLPQSDLHFEISQVGIRKIYYLIGVVLLLVLFTITLRAYSRTILTAKKNIR